MSFDDMKKNHSFIVALCLFSSAALAATTPQNVDTFYVKPGEASPLVWKTDAGKAISYSITDTWGQNIVSANTVPENGTITLNVTVPPGYYTLAMPESKESFGIVSLPVFEGKTDPYFSIDSAMAWLVKSVDHRAGFIAAFKRNGVAMSRERLSWRGINAAENQWDWNTRSRYDELANQYVNTDVPVLQMFHDAPDYLGQSGKFPTDLIKTSDAWTTILNRNQKFWNAMEVWNEPDIGFGGHMPADQMTPLLHTFTYMCQQNGFSLPLGGGVMAALNKEYFANAAENGMLQSCNFFSFHCYTRALAAENQIALLRGWLSEFNQPGKPIWITECGLPWKRGPMRPEMQEDAVSAMEITAKAIEFRACGVERYFPFVAPYYEEKAANFGMIGKEGTPLRSMAGYLTAIRLLSHQPYLGDLNGMDSAIKRARVFSGRDRVIVAIYTAKAASGATVACDIAAKDVLGIDGRKLSRTSDGKIPVPDGITYLVADAASLGSRLKSDTSAMRLYKFAQQPTPKLQRVPPVIPQYVNNSDVVSASAECYRVPAEATSHFSMRVRLTNLDARSPKTLHVAPYVGPTRLAAPVTVELAPRTVGQAEWTMDLRDTFSKQDRAVIRIDADESGIMQPLMLAVATERLLSDWQNTFKRVERLPLSQLDRWSGNSVPGSVEKFNSPAEGSWRFDVTIPKKVDAWAYPKFSLPDSMTLDGAAGLLLKVRCDKPATVRLFAWESQSIGYMTVNGIIPMDDRWHTVYIPFDRFSASPLQEPDANGQLDLDKVRTLSIGFNSRELTNSLEVSDCFVVWSRK